MFDSLSKDMVFTPYPADKLIYRGDRVVEYRTPPGSEGLGTIISRFKPSEQPIEGVGALVGEMPEIDLLLVGARLSPEMAAFEPAIVQELERRVARGEPRN